MIIIHTDGSNVHNGKIWSYGGYGYVIEHEGHTIEGGGSMYIDTEQPVTNNRAELLAIITALELVNDIGFTSTPIKVVSDSKWCVECANGNWARKKNVDLWNRFVQVKHRLRLKRNTLEVEWIKGHAGHEMNELADKLAGQYKDAAKPAHEVIEKLKCSTITV